MVAWSRHLIARRGWLLAYLDGDVILCQTVLGVVVRDQVVEKAVVLRVVDEYLRQRLPTAIATCLIIRLLLLDGRPPLPHLPRHIALIILTSHLITIICFVLCLWLVGLDFLAILGQVVRPRGAALPSAWLL